MPMMKIDQQSTPKVIALPDRASTNIGGKAPTASSTKTIALPDRAASRSEGSAVEGDLKSFQNVLDRKRDEGGGGKGSAPQFTPAEEKQLREACEGFETMFINQMLAEMRKIKFNKDEGESYGKEMYQDMFDQEIAKSMAKRGVGLADMLFRQITHDPRKVYRPQYKGGLQMVNVKS